MKVSGFLCFVLWTSYDLILCLRFPMHFHKFFPMHVHEFPDELSYGYPKVSYGFLRFPRVSKDS